MEKKEKKIIEKKFAKFKWGKILKKTLYQIKILNKYEKNFKKGD